MGYSVSQTVVATVSSAFFKLGGAGREIQLVVSNQYLTGRDFEKVCECFYRKAAAIHESSGIQQVELKALQLNAGIVPVVFLFGAERLTRFAGQCFNEEGAGIMAGILVVRTGVTQPNHHDNILCHLPTPPE